MNYKNGIINRINEISKLTYTKKFLEFYPMKDRKCEIILEELDNIIKRINKIKKC